MPLRFKTALIVGAGSGLERGAGAAAGERGRSRWRWPRARPAISMTSRRRPARRTFTCDASKPRDVEKLFADLDRRLGAPEIVIYNASYRTRGPFVGPRSGRGREVA